MTTSIGEPGMDCSGCGSCWTSLPAEVRLMILREIVRQRLRGWASCAAVCKEWQAVIEPQNFHRLTLRESCMPAIKQLPNRPRRFIQYICLNTELPRYTCDNCEETMPQSEALRHSLPFGFPLLKLFSVLNCRQFVGPLTLELNPYSPSDSEHWFKIDRSGLESEDKEDLILQKGATARWHDPRHGWVDGRQVEAPGKSAILRLFAPLHFPQAILLQKVHSVTGLVIRRQLRRQISPRCLNALLKNLPQLQTLVYEPWRVWWLDERDKWYPSTSPYCHSFQLIPACTNYLNRFGLCNSAQSIAST